MLESFILGAVQGLAEWLPVSSEGMITIVKANFFSDGASLSEIIHLALFLHMGTLFAAGVYFRHDVMKLIHTILSFHIAKKEDKNILVFLVLSTLISGSLGFLLLGLLTNVEGSAELSGRSITTIVGVFLLFTGFMQYRSRKHTAEKKDAGGISLVDAGVLGLAQTLAVIPGVSRSGITVSSLLLRNFSEHEALRLSFLMSMPIVLAGNIILNMELFTWNTGVFLGLLSSFAFGMATIHILLFSAKKIRFDIFTFIFGLLMIASALL